MEQGGVTFEQQPLPQRKKKLIKNPKSILSEPQLQFQDKIVALTDQSFSNSEQQQIAAQQHSYLEKADNSNITDLNKENQNASNQLLSNSISAEQIKSKQQILDELAKNMMNNSSEEDDYDDKGQQQQNDNKKDNQKKLQNQMKNNSSAEINPQQKEQKESKPETKDNKANSEDNEQSDDIQNVDDFYDSDGENDSDQQNYDENDQEFELKKKKSDASHKKKQKQVKSSMASESFLVEPENNENLLQRLHQNPIFAVEDNETENGSSASGEQNHTLSTNLQMHQTKERKKKSTNSRTKQTHDPNLIKSRNKLFGAINSMDLLQTIQEEPVAEEEFLENKKIVFGEKKSNQCKTLNELLQPLNKFRIERGLIDTPQKEQDDQKKKVTEKMEILEERQTAALVQSGEYQQQQQQPNSFLDVKLSQNSQMPALLFPQSGSSDNQKMLQESTQNQMIVLSSEDTVNNVSQQQSNQSQPLQQQQQQQQGQPFTQPNSISSLSLSNQNQTQPQPQPTAQNNSEQSAHNMNCSAISTLQAASHTAQEQLEEELQLRRINQMVHNSGKKQNKEKVQFKFPLKQCFPKSFDQKQLDECLQLDIELQGLQRSSSIASVTNNTIYINKLARTTSQILLNNLSDSQASEGSNCNISNIQSQTSLNKLGSKLSREQIIQQQEERIKEKKSRNIDFEELKKRFQKTTFDQIVVDKKPSTNQNSASNLLGNNNDSSNNLSQQDYGDNQNNDNSQGQLDPELEKLNQQREKEYQKLLAFENGEEYHSEDENEEENEENSNEEENKEKEKEAPAADMVEGGQKVTSGENQPDQMSSSNNNNNNNINIPGNSIIGGQSSSNADDKAKGKNSPNQNDNNSENTINEMIQQPQQIGETVNNAKSENKQEINESKSFENMTEEEKQKVNEKLRFKRLKNIAAQILEKKENERKRQQQKQRKLKEKEMREKFLKENPEIVKEMDKLLDNEAELGSDNEDHDDIVKEIDKEQELKEEGLEGLDLDQELAELINNQVEINEDMEQQAYQRFLKDLQKQDKEEIQAIILGKYRGGVKRSAKMLEDELEENELNLRRLQRMEQTIKELEERENVYGDNNDDQNNQGSVGKKKKQGGQANEEEEEEEQRQRIMENALIIKNELKKINKNEITNVDESAFVDTDIFTLYAKQNKVEPKSQQQQQDQTQLQKKRIIPKQLEGIQKFGQVNNKFISNSILQIRQNKNITSQLNDNYQPIDLNANEYSKSIGGNGQNTSCSMNSALQRQSSVESMPAENSNSFRMGFAINEQVQKQIHTQNEKSQIHYKLKKSSSIVEQLIKAKIDAIDTQINKQLAKDHGQQQEQKQSKSIKKISNQTILNKVFQEQTTYLRPSPNKNIMVFKQRFKK